MLNGWFSSLRKENSKKREVNMKAKLCLKNLFIVSTLILIAFAASSCTLNADPPVYYTITAAEEIENGTVSVDKTSATSGETVKITATADYTYVLSALSVTDENGNKIPVTDGSFTMPASSVTVSATFSFAVLKTGPEINSILSTILSNLGLSTKAQFLPSENPPTTDETVYLISTDESEIPAYVWENGFTVYYYAKGYTDSNQLIPLNPNSYELFYNCDNLKTIDLSGFDTSSVTSMDSMFCLCSALTSLDLSGFDTSKVTDMSAMFNGCSGLTSLDLSGLDTSSVTDMHCMFECCSKLTTIYVSSAFNTNSVTNSRDMFYKCTSLKGGEGTAAYGSDKIDKTYARIDGGTSAPGYFTEK